ALQDVEAGEGGREEAARAVVRAVIGEAVEDDRGRGVEQALGGEAERGHGSPPGGEFHCTAWYMYQLVQYVVGSRQGACPRPVPRQAARRGDRPPAAGGGCRPQPARAGGGDWHQPPHAAVPLRLARGSAGGGGAGGGAGATSVP